MNPLSTWYVRFKAFLLQSNGRKGSVKPPILKLSRTYCILAIGAALLISVCIYLNAWLWEEIAVMQTELFRKGLYGSIFLNRFNFFLNWFGLLLLAGAILYGFKMARQASIDARRNEEILQEAKQRTIEIAALYDITQDVSSQHDLSSLLNTIAGKAKTLLAAAGCAIFLYEKEQDDFQIAVESGVGMPIGTRLSRTEGLAGLVAETLQPLIVNDYHNWPNRSKPLRQLPIGATVCVPMVRRGELIGVLGVHEVVGTSRAFTEADARLLSLFADNAAGAVHNARLLDALKNSEERFRIASECASDIVYDWDLAKDSVEFFGAMFRRTWGGDEVLPRTRREFSKMVHHDDRERVRAALRNHFKTGAPYSEEYRIIDGRGACLTIWDRATAIRNQNGDPVRLIGVVSDITERKKAEKMKSDFVSFVSHQLRTPLSGIKWMLELAMNERENSEDVLSFIQDARASTDRLIRLVNDLLDSSRLERGKLEISLQPIDLAGLTKEVLAEISPLIQEKVQVLSAEIPDDLPRITADKQMLRQAILNLISNAMKYTPRGGKIRIAARREDGHLRWEVEDTGIGIPQSDLGKLFEKFYRAENAVAVETEGTGLGLYLVRLIVERFGGKVWCTSEEGVGSTFAFTLPLPIQEA
ncbi:MAG: GAF domain-containing protein [Acidobacteria bacterium]|nr:GAF domain-containing protein [Acidobacteriota bacterium]